MPLSGRHAARLAWSAFGVTTLLAVFSVFVGFVDDGIEVLPPETGVVSAAGALALATMIVAFAALGAHRGGVVRETMQPAHVSIWRRLEARR